MTIVFVHGVPETAEIWDDVRARLDRHTTAVSLPGFAGRRSGAQTQTKDVMVEAVLAEIDRCSAPVDLVGHDWGTALVLRIATAYPERVRSWVVDIAALAHPAYVWHDLAQVWQSGDGEKWMQDVLDDGKARGVPRFFEQLGALGVPGSEVSAMASAFDETMAKTVLDLYRSAVPNIDTDWRITGAGATPRPGLVLRATEDPFDNDERAREVAALLGADVAALPGCSHFWMKQDPGLAAEVLDDWLIADP
ncbi:hypothetical protein AD006_31980 (plasmid) [Pseudonocardia sp. EC080610-09]|uniref:alpha/beta fold hydrolase n=1 Tax=unclassified Pseudonocardia TaxID=2619320 RepID=UPI0007068999|nr:MULTISPECIES: alpha/beta hydrolase [unclassified Pseudonocardia]ALL79750.1 hypothetical protein AD006_31980 [Pseudonocardia sp. EC080610-09]ALL85185.1 hypothetical protein AD017_28510 [Pseudonocardia sp. EC080619-01]